MCLIGCDDFEFDYGFRVLGRGGVVLCYPWSDLRLVGVELHV